LRVNKNRRGLISAAGNRVDSEQKTAPHGFHSEPFFRFGINFQTRSAFPLTLLFIGSLRILHLKNFIRHLLLECRYFYDEDNFCLFLTNVGAHVL
jgi:hypothetical protein